MNADPLGLSGVTLEGKYDIAETVAVVGPRVTYRALHRAWGATVLMHVTAPDATVGTPVRDNAVRAFVKAAGDLAGMSGRCSAFLHVRDAGTLTTSAGMIGFAVSEWLEGTTVAAMPGNDWASVLRLPIDERLDWMAPVLEALAVLHRAGRVHGRVGPSLLWAQPTLSHGPGTLKLLGVLDGLWRAAAAGVVPALPVDPTRAAPEQRTGDESRVGPWTDIFCAGHLLTELAAGRTLPADPAGAIAAVTGRVPQPVEHVLARALADDPEHRFRTVDAFRAVLFEAVSAAMPRAAQRRPRQTMVVSEQALAGGELGSAGSFEVGAGAAPAVPGPREPDAPRARVRLGHTQRAEVAQLPGVTPPQPAIPVATPVSQTPVPAAPTGSSKSGAYEFRMQAPRAETHTWLYVAIGAGVAAMVGVLIALISSN